LDPSIQHIQLDDTCYYGAQFNTAIQHIRENVMMCVIVGDNLAENDFAKIFHSALHAMNTYTIGIYAPHDKRSHNQTVLRAFKDSMYHVKNTDCGFWFIHPTIVKKMKGIDYTMSKYGWGIDMIFIREAKSNNLAVISDHSIETDQLDHTCGYNREDACSEGTRLIRAYVNHRKPLRLPFVLYK
jgi:surface polysaccharide O-acyltransferase-like enzyme